MHDAGLHAGQRKNRGDRLGKALQPINDRDQNVLYPAVAQLVHDFEPELGSFILLDPNAQHIPSPVAGDA